MNIQRNVFYRYLSTFHAWENHLAGGDDNEMKLTIMITAAVSDKCSVTGPVSGGPCSHGHDYIQKSEGGAEDPRKCQEY